MKKDYQMMAKAYQQAGGNPEDFNSGCLMIDKNKVLKRQLVEGLNLAVKETSKGAVINLVVDQDVCFASPVHLCFGVLAKEGRQEIKIKILVKKGAALTIVAHCVFPNAVDVSHVMEGEIILEEEAVFRYQEIHDHGLSGGVKIFPQAKIKIGKGSHFVSNFSLLKGRVGDLNLDYQAEVGENGVLEMLTKIYGYGSDKIKIRESGRLISEGARGLIKSRIAVRERAESEMTSELIALAANTKGHVDCVEVVQDRAKARAVPLVSVLHDKAQITHEAAIGRINQRELETLMARGLKQEEAAAVIIRGMLK